MSRTQLKIFTKRWNAFVLVLLLSAILSPGSSRADQQDFREKISDRCYDILHNGLEAGEEEQENCLTEFYGVTTVIVSASRKEQNLAETAAPASVVTSKELERRAVDSVAEVLRDLPAVEVSDAGEAGHMRIRIRGEEARRIMILIDGQEFDDQREVGTPILIAPEMIERIEVVRGPGSVLYGSKAIGGVINIITKKGGYHPIQGAVSSTFDSATSGWQQFATAYGSHADFDYRIAAVSGDHSERDTPKGDLDNTAYSYDSVMGYFGKSIDDHEIGVALDLYQSESDVFVEEEVRTSPPFLDFAIDVPQRDRKKAGVFYDWHDVSDNLERMHVDAYFQRSERKFDTFSRTLIDIGMPLQSDTSIRSSSELDNLGLTAQSDWRIGASHSLVFGYQLNIDDLSQERLRDVVSNGAGRPREFVEDEGSRDSHALFLQDEWAIFDDTIFTVGGRVFWLSSELDSTSRAGLSPHSNSDNDAIGSIGLAYSGLSNTNIWGRVAQGYLYPTLTETATGAFAGPDYVNPNSELEPEESLTYDAGIRISDQYWSLDLSAFFSEAQDLIDFVKCTESEAVCLEPAGRNDRVYVNIDRAKSYGAESIISYQAEEFMPYLSLAWIRRRESTEALSTYDTGLPTVASRFGLKWEDKVAESLGAWIDFYIRASSDSDEKEGADETLHKSGWTTLNVSGGLQFGEKQRSRLILELRNLGDKYYVPATENLAAQGLSAAVKLVLEF